MTSFDHRILAAYEVDDKESVLCLWNLNLNQISETEPFKIIHAPGHIRALCYLKTQPTIVCAGFKNGDLRILDLETNEWSKLYKGNPSPRKYFNPIFHPNHFTLTSSALIKSIFQAIIKQ